MFRKEELKLLMLLFVKGVVWFRSVDFKCFSDDRVKCGAVPFSILHSV